MKPIIVLSPANIAFIKYWGQRNPDLVIPCNDSFSMNLSACTTTLQLEKVADRNVQELHIQRFGEDTYSPASPEQLKKVTAFYDVAKNFLNAKGDFGFIIKSKNTFPMKAGIASSASFFSALALAFTTAFETHLDEKQLSVLARLSGSGSAARSIPEGFVCLLSGTDDDSDSAYAESIAAPDFWQLADIVLIVDRNEKKTGSQEGHQGAFTSPYFASRQHDLKLTTIELKVAFAERNFTKFGTLVEKEAINFCSILMTQTPPLYYWTAETLACMKEIVRLRETGLEAYFTIDAGANLHLICQKKDVERLEEHFRPFPGVMDTIVNFPCAGAHLL